MATKQLPSRIEATNTPSVADIPVKGVADELDRVSQIPATQVSIVDAGGYYTSTDVEGALQEIGGTVGALSSSLVYTGYITPINLYALENISSGEALRVKRVNQPNDGSTVFSSPTTIPVGGSATSSVDWGISLYLQAGTVLSNLEVERDTSTFECTMSYTSEFSIYNTTGTQGTNALPTGAALATSTAGSGGLGNGASATIIDNLNISYVIPTDGVYAIRYEVDFSGTSTLSVGPDGIISCDVSGTTVASEFISVSNAFYNNTPSIISQPYLNILDPIYGVVLLDTSTVEGSFFLGLSTATYSFNDAISYQYSGISTQSGLIVGSDYYGSDTPGAISTTEGTVCVPVGRAISTTQLNMNYTRGDEVIISDAKMIYMTLHGCTFYVNTSMSGGAGVAGASTINKYDLTGITIINTYGNRSEGSSPQYNTQTLNTVKPYFYYITVTAGSLDSSRIVI